MGIKTSFSDLGPLDVTTDSSGNVVGVDPNIALAQYNPGKFLGIGKNIQFNTGVNWFDPSATIAYNQNGQQVTYNLLAAKAFQLNITTISASQFMDLTLLHELAHSFGLDHPATDSTDFDENIWMHCFK